MVELDQVSVTYPETAQIARLEVLRELSFKVHRGEIFTLIGPSGCGKTTLLKVISGLMAPTEGAVRVAGEAIVGPRPDAIAMVFQEYSLLPWRTVAANVELALELRGVRRNERRERAAAELAKVGLEGFVGAYPGQLSGGMRQRVAIARALAVDTPIMLLDEPFGALDEQTRTVLGEELSRLLADTDKAIVLITHSLAEAAFLSDRIAVLGRRPGRVVEIVENCEPHPRDARYMTSASFHATRDRLFELLHDEMVAATGVASEADR